MSKTVNCEKILPLFGVNSVEELKKVIEDNPVKPNYGYQNDCDSIPPIPLQIDNYEVGSLK